MTRIITLKARNQTLLKQTLKKKKCQEKKYQFAQQMEKDQNPKLK